MRERSPLSIRMTVGATATLKDTLTILHRRKVKSARIPAQRLVIHARIDPYVPTRRRALRAVLDLLPNPVKQALQVLHHEAEVLHGKFCIGRCRELAEAVLHHGLANDRSTSITSRYGLPYFWRSSTSSSLISLAAPGSW